ncbi:MAG: twin-arginine translocation signal domain-containing protein, partial [Hyphomicrobium sp.]|nr:twin-arginine translocation signal domain-containing protein [Hyphomicrobium sp.]
MKSKSTVTRRDLIRNAGLAGAAVATGGLVATPAVAQAPQAPTRWDREADVVIIGAGAT